MVIADYYIISIGQKIPEINLDHTINVNSYKIPMKNYSTKSSEMFFLRILKGVCYDFFPLERGEIIMTMIHTNGLNQTMGR